MTTAFPIRVIVFAAAIVPLLAGAARPRLEGPAAAQDQDPSQGLFVRYMDPISGAAVLVRRLLPHDEAVRLLEQVRTAEGPGSAVRAWKSGADVEPPINAGSPLSCRFTDIRSGLTLSTDCQPTFEDVTAWMQLEPEPGKTRSACCSPLHTERLFGLLSRSGVIAIGPYVQRDGGSIQVWAGRGRLRESDGPSFVSVSARDGRTGRGIVFDASRMTDGTTKTHLEALNAATTLEEMVDVVRAGGPSGVVAAEGTLSTNSSRLRVLIRRGDAAR